MKRKIKLAKDARDTFIRAIVCGSRNINIRDIHQVNRTIQDPFQDFFFPFKVAPCDKFLSILSRTSVHGFPSHFHGTSSAIVAELVVVPAGRAIVVVFVVSLGSFVDSAVPTAREVPVLPRVHSTIRLTGFIWTATVGSSGDDEKCDQETNCGRDADLSKCPSACCRSVIALGHFIGVLDTFYFNKWFSSSEGSVGNVDGTNKSESSLRRKDCMI